MSDITDAWEDFSLDNYGKVIVKWDELPPDSQEAFRQFRRMQGSLVVSGSPKGRKMSPCDEDVRMFVIAQFGMTVFSAMVEADPSAAERTLSNLVHVIRTGKVPRRG